MKKRVLTIKIRYLDIYNRTWKYADFYIGFRFQKNPVRRMAAIDRAGAFTWFLVSQETWALFPLWRQGVSIYTSIIPRKFPCIP